MNIHDTLSAALPVYFEGVLRRSAEHLMAHLLGRPREWVVAHPEAELTAGQVEQFNHLAARYADGVPFAYLTGEQPFLEYTFIVTPDVLVPRPETEQVVELALRRLAASPHPPRLLDLGTGAGIIAVSLALKLPGAHVTATDISPAALDVARANAGRHGVLERMEFVESDLLSALLHRRPPPAFDLICANLPYIPSADLETLEVARHEPLVALDGGLDGLGFIRRFLADAPRVLMPGGRSSIVPARPPALEAERRGCSATKAAPGGCILLEIDYRQGPGVAALAREYFPTAQVTVHRDLAGLDRVVEIAV